MSAARALDGAQGISIADGFPGGMMQAAGQRTSCLLCRTGLRETPALRPPRFS